MVSNECLFVFAYLYLLQVRMGRSKGEGAARGDEQRFG